ncbi:uncharacterized protein LOC127729151 [Mytilus californianus]|uniref:uncharacterized protein LOC127729151 n=1 Tax=Mytilus californianus TaxID=6549 RepID=UPI0022451B2F|nr:uncharacterized protein LOC127729151 [Mytilus californianus]
MDNTGNHYKPFESTLGTDTSEKYRPSSQNQTLVVVAQEQQGCKNNMLTAQNVRMTVNCKECDKPRCVYSKLKISARDTRSQRHILEKYDYTCGSVITPDVFVRLQMFCSTHNEFPFYSSSIGRTDICCHCTSPNAGKDENAFKTHRVVLSCCQTCLPKGITKRMPKK